jgi:dTMP kinase
MTGKLIVIDGADGSGKATQTKLLVERLVADGYMVHTLDFPQYTQNHFGRLLRECLDGKRGNFLESDPRVASTLYAADRFESSDLIREWLEDGAVVVLDRYVSSNMLHQGGKIQDGEELASFLTWLDAMEHTVFGIPRPDLIVFLDVPFSYRQKMLFTDSSRTHLDTVEVDVTYQEAAETNARRLTASHNNWTTVACIENDNLLPRELISTKVYEAVTPVLPKRFEN